MNSRETRNPLIRDGVAQQQRQMAALATDYVQVDEKDLADFLVFAHDLSQRVAYYNLENKQEGNWHVFFERSTPVQIALICKARPQVLQDMYERELRQFLAQWAIAPAASPGSPSQRLEKLQDLLEVYAKVLATLQTWYYGLADGTPLKSTVQASGRSNLPIPLNRLYWLEQGLKSCLVSRGGCDRRQALYQEVATLFDLGNLPLQQVEGVVSDRLLTLDLRQLITNRIQAQTELNGIFQPLFKTYSQIIQRAPGALHESLYADQNLSPHLALYVAFWEVLKPARADLNRMTQRHLDFFFRQVLGLTEQPPQPDKAHVILELARFQQTHRLEQQTRLSAGADATGVDLFYTLNDEIVVNTAQVAELKGLFIHSRQQQGSSTNPSPPEILGVHASPMANSADGWGGGFPKEQAVRAWLPFGDASRPAAALGLAIASPVLLLQEGKRTITFQITLKLPSELTSAVLDALNKPPPPDGASLTEDYLWNECHVDFSGEAGWISGANTFSLSSSNDTAKYILTVEVKLSEAAEPVLPYHGGLPGAPLGSDRPVARLILRHQESDADTAQTEKLSVYHYLREAEVEEITITTEVEGVRNLLLQNDLAILDATKPFLPFGPQPKVGANFYIGSQEVFQKHLTRLEILYDLETPPPLDENEIRWAKIYAAYDAAYTIKDNKEDFDFDPGHLAIAALRERQWYLMTPEIATTLFSKSKETPADPTETSNFSYRLDLTEHLGSLQLQSFVDSKLSTEPLLPWTYQSQYGFVRSQLTGRDFLHADYPTVLARQVLATATQEIIEVSDEFPDSKKRRAVIGAYYKAKPVEPQKTDNTKENNEVESNGEAGSNGEPNSNGEAENNGEPNGDAESNKEEIFRANQYYVGLNDVPILPGEPYTPVIRSLQLDYTAEAVLQDDYQLFHLYPFDGSVALPTAPSVP
ncbi:MAG: hypothetical protein VKK04_14375, partial [Synechococcales bacterium]|nr:hypothetical protein [Synechococcales bacterium]